MRRVHSESGASGVVASRPKRLPVVLSASEMRSVLAQLDGTPRLIANLLYGSGKAGISQPAS
jgi:hypothetical protein